MEKARLPVEWYTLELAIYIILATIILRIISVADRLSIMENDEIDHTLLEDSSHEIVIGIINRSEFTLIHQYRLDNIGKINKDAIISESFNIY